MRAVLVLTVACAIGLFFSCGREGSEDADKSGHPDGADAGSEGGDAANDGDIDGCLTRGQAICPVGANTGGNDCPFGDGCNFCICDQAGIGTRACSTRACDPDAEPMGCTLNLPANGAPCRDVGQKCWYRDDAGVCFHPICASSGWQIGDGGSCL